MVESSYGVVCHKPETVKDEEPQFLFIYSYEVCPLADLCTLYPTYCTCFKGFLTPQMRHLFRFSILILALLLGAPGLNPRPEKHSNFRLFGIELLS